MSGHEKGFVALSLHASVKYFSVPCVWKCSATVPVGVEGTEVMCANTASGIVYLQYRYWWRT